MSSADSDHPAKPPAQAPDLPTTGDLTLRRIGDALRGLRYGSVLVVVQDGVMVQIERTEKTRFGK